MLPTDTLLLGLPAGEELFHARRLQARCMAYMHSIPEDDRPRRERAILLCKAALNLAMVRSSRFRHHITSLP